MSEFATKRKWGDTVTHELFVRSELKFLVDMEQYKSLIKALQSHVECDDFGNEDGFYRVSSLYFDTDDYRFYFEHMNGIPFRQKLRLRVYNDVTLSDIAFLEIKKKFKGIVSKRRVALPLSEAYALFESSNHPKVTEWSQVYNEAMHIYHFLKLRPRTIVTYMRQAFKDRGEHNLRITFDSQIGLCDQGLRLENVKAPLLIVPENNLVMEVKTDAAVPNWLSRVLSTHSCFDQGFSKYAKGIQHLQYSQEAPSVRELF